MNKGLIMEVRKNYAIALNDEGIMDKIVSKQNMTVGQKVFYFEDDIVTATTNKAHGINNFMKAFGSIAALFLLVFTFFNTLNYEQAYAVVSLDINPSIQIEADSKQQIIKVEGINIDGKNIDFTDIKDIPLDDGIQKIKEILIEKNYLDTNKEVLVGFAFIENGENSDYEDDLKDAIQTTFNTETVTYVKADKEAIDEAKTKGISLGRYEASLMADEATKSNIDKAPVKDITSSIKDKENVIQWEAEDEKEKDIPANNPDVKNETPVINIPPENIQSDTDTQKQEDKDKVNNNTPQNNEVLDLEPEKPVQNGTDKGSEPKDDGTIIIEPDKDTIENSPTSGKIDEIPDDTEQIPGKTAEDLIDNTTEN